MMANNLARCWKQEKIASKLFNNSTMKKDTVGSTTPSQLSTKAFGGPTSSRMFNCTFKTVKPATYKPNQHTRSLQHQYLWKDSLIDGKSI